MGMLTKEDLRQIGDVIDEKMDQKFVVFEQKIDTKMDEKFSKFGEHIVPKIVDEVVVQVVSQVGEMLEQNVLPQFEVIHDDLKGMKGRLTTIEANMVTKTYLDEKLGALKGDLIAQDRKLEKKTDALIDSLTAHGTLVSPDLERLETTRVFPQT